MSKRESEKWRLVYKNGHVRTEKNTSTYLNKNCKIVKECLDCRKNSPSRNHPEPTFSKKSTPERTSNICRNGHPRTEKNTHHYVIKTGEKKMKCRDCVNERNKSIRLSRKPQ